MLTWWNFVEIWFQKFSTGNVTAIKNKKKLRMTVYFSVSNCSYGFTIEVTIACNMEECVRLYSQIYMMLFLFSLDSSLTTMFHLTKKVYINQIHISPTVEVILQYSFTNFILLEKEVGWKYAHKCNLLVQFCLCFMRFLWNSMRIINMIIRVNWFILYLW